MPRACWLRACDYTRHAPLHAIRCYVLQWRIENFSKLGVSLCGSTVSEAGITTWWVVGLGHHSVVPAMPLLTALKRARGGCWCTHMVRRMAPT
jgi:uncharacterized protein